MGADRVPALRQPRKRNPKMDSISIPRFACDAMLGGLARWLRAAGYDACWQEGIDDGELIRLARHALAGNYGEAAAGIGTNVR